MTNIEFALNLNDFSRGEFSLGIYTLIGEDEGGAFHSVHFGFIFFEIEIAFYHDAPPD